MKLIPTAEELIIKQYGEIWEKRPESQKKVLTKETYIDLFGLGKIDGVEPGTKELMIEYAKLHVEAALRTASEKAELDYWEGDCQLCRCNVINKDSILDAYPLTLIK